LGENFNFQDLFKKSILHLDTFRTVSYADILLGLACSFCIGMFIYFVYKYTFRGVVYSYNYNVTFVLMAMITAMIIMTISTNIVLSLGMVGALSIVRFRTAVKDPLDIVYLFWAVAAGIASGAKLYPLALIGSAAIGLALYFLSRKKIRTNPYLLIIRYSEIASDEVKNQMVKMTYQLKSKTVRKDMTEMTVELRLRDDNTAFVNALSEIEGVADVTLVNYRGDYAQ
jgi:uncharacterized membrane protein YhiD involved in acid resistance